MRINATRRGVKWAAVVSIGLATMFARFGVEATLIGAIGGFFGGAICFACGHDGYLYRKDGDTLLLYWGFGLGLLVVALLRAAYLAGASVGDVEWAVPRVMGEIMLGGFSAGVWWARRKPGHSR